MFEGLNSRSLPNSLCLFCPKQNSNSQSNNMSIFLSKNAFYSSVFELWTTKERLNKPLIYLSQAMTEGDLDDSKNSGR
jgi:hypothetical protein